MRIKSLRDVRLHYKKNIRQKTDPNINTDFIGVYHEDNGKRTTGLFELFHGDKKIEKFLPSLLKIAEDGQAIYEFLQNAVDCNSTQFFIFYSDDYFLAVNNGKPFNHKDVLSILNIANTTKDYGCDKIGRFGIGFKLVHRLVGKDEGIKGLTEDYKGPVIFSWNKIDSLRLLLSKPDLYPNDQINPVSFDNDVYPWLFKIIATNFPAEPGETVLDINYQERVVFPYPELGEMVDFLKQNFKIHSGAFNFDNLQQGSAFFLKLGEGKRTHLDEDYNDLQKGVQYSMNFLKRLQEVFINDQALKKEELTIKEFQIIRGSEVFTNINPEYNECNIKISFGYTDFWKAATLRTSPNFYKYFPMGDETNGFSFIIHCDSFDIEANRRKLHESNKNKNLLPEIAKNIVRIADDLKFKNRKGFIGLYANLLVSKIPSNDNNKWLNDCFFNFILDYLQTNIPTEKGFSNNSKNVKIKSFEFPVSLEELGIDDVNWFYWLKPRDELLLVEAMSADKLNIEKWHLREVLIQANLEKLNNWIKALSESNYTSFVKELDRQYFNTELITCLLESKLFKFSDDEFYAISEVFDNANLLFRNNKINNISNELEKLGFIVSDLDISDLRFYEKISSKIKEDIIIYENIAAKTAESNVLSPADKLNLFKNFGDPETKFSGVAEDTLKKLKVFCNAKGEIKAVKDLLAFGLPTPPWLQSYKITSNEYAPFLNKYLLAESEIYRVLILPNWDIIINDISNQKDFYEQVRYYFLLEENNASLHKQKYIFTASGIKESSVVFYNNHLTGKINYTDIQSALYKLTGASTPSKDILIYLSELPFKTDVRNLRNYDIIETAQFEVSEVQALITLANLNNENFFENYIIEQSGKNLLILNKQIGVNQYFSNDLNVIRFINTELKDKFKLLPKVEILMNQTT